MGKFKKLLEKKSKENKREYKYIGYKKLKRKINEIFIKLRLTKNSIININPRESIFSKFLGFFTMKRLNEGEYSSKISNLQDFIKNDLIKNFFHELNNEIHSVYKFYSCEESAISNELNQLLIHKNEENEKLTTIDDYSQKLYLLSLQIKLLYECLILNFEAIRKICKKFDKKLKIFVGGDSFCVYYLKTLIYRKNSDLCYMLRMQTIEQGLILIQNRLNYITQREKILLSKSNKESIVSNDYNGEITEADLIKEIDGHIEKSKNIIESIITKEQYIMTNINLGLLLKYNFESDDDKKDGIRLSMLNDDEIDNQKFEPEYANILKQKEESLSNLRLFVNKNVYQNIIYLFFYYLNDANHTNIVLIFFHLFFNYFLLGISYIQILYALKLYKNEQATKYYGLILGFIILVQFFASKMKNFLLWYKYKLLILISSTMVILTQVIYLLGINYIEYRTEIDKYFWLFSFLYSLFIGIPTSTSISVQYLINLVPKNTLVLLLKNLTFHKYIFLYLGLILYYLFDKNFCLILIMSFILMSFLIFFFFTEKDSKDFYQFRPNLKELSEKIEFFDKNGMIIQKKDSNDINNDIILSDEPDLKESIMNLEELKNSQKIKIEKANEEFSNMNEKSNFNVSNLVLRNTKNIIKNISDNSKNRRGFFLFLFQFLSSFYKQAILIIFLINYTNNNIDRTIFKKQLYDIIVILSLPIGYLLYKAFNRYNDIHYIFRFYFIINCVLLFIFAFQYNSKYILFFFMIFISFNYVMDGKINMFFAINYRNEESIFKIKLNKLFNFAYYFGKIFGSLSFYFFVGKEFWFLSFGTFIYFLAIFYYKFIQLPKIILLGRVYSKEIN